MDKFFFLDNLVQLSQFCYGAEHPLDVESRYSLLSSLLRVYRLYQYIFFIAPSQATIEEMSAFHEKDYLDFLQRHNYDIQAVDAIEENVFEENLRRFNLDEGSDCRFCRGIFEFCSLYAGSTLKAARILNAYNGSDVVAFNWGGGGHHAKPGSAAGYCFVNDVILGVNELLKVYPRILYIDIDVHHGDEVERAFFSSNRVFTLSIHCFQDNFYPGTGDICDVGVGSGKYYAFNIPLKRGVTDESYTLLFEHAFKTIISAFSPNCIVMLCGADCLAHDPKGAFNLTLDIYPPIFKLVKSALVPLLILGGGGYNSVNVAKAWTYITAILLGKDDDLPKDIPDHEYIQSYAPSYQLGIIPDSELPDENSPEHINFIFEQIDLLADRLNMS